MSEANAIVWLAATVTIAEEEALAQVAELNVPVDRGGEVEPPGGHVVVQLDVRSQEIGLEGDAGYHAWVGHLVHRLIEECEDGRVPRTQEALVAEAERRWQPERKQHLLGDDGARRPVCRVPE